MATIYQRDNQKASIEEGQTIQWPKDTKGIIRRHKWYLLAIVSSVLL
jgi:hypothetical protein